MDVTTKTRPRPLATRGKSVCHVRVGFSIIPSCPMSGVKIQGISWLRLDRDEQRRAAPDERGHLGLVLDDQNPHSENYGRNYSRPVGEGLMPSLFEWAGY